MEKEIKRLCAENTKLDKRIISLKNQEIEKRVELEKAVILNSKDRENNENKARLEVEKVKEVFKEKEEKLKIELKNSKKEIDLLKQLSNNGKDFNINSVIKLEKQVSELNKELDLTKKENHRIKRNSKNFEKQINKIRDAPVQYMNLAEEEEDLVTVLKLNQKLEKLLQLKKGEIEELNATYKSLLNNEKQKIIELKEKLTRNRNKYNNEKTQLLQELTRKDESLALIKQKFKGFNSTNPSTPGSKYGRNSDLTNLSNAEYTLLRFCQKMVDASSRMECK